MKFRIAIIILAAVGLAVILLLRSHLNRDAVGAAKPPVVSVESSRRIGPTERTVPVHTESAEFIRLRDKWKLVNGGANWRIYGRDHLQLARECVLNLGCGEELIRLIDAVSSDDKRIEAGVFSKVIREILAGPDGGKQRPLIAAISSDPATRNRWCYYAGAGCSVGELDLFASSLKTEEDRNAARLGSCLDIAAKEPGAGVAAAVVELEAGRAGDFQPFVLKDIVEATGSVNSFPELEAQLGVARRIQPDDDNFVNEARNQLLRQWSAADPENLIEHFNSHEASMTGKEAESVLSHLAVLDSAKAFELVQDFKHAVHFDSAAVAVVLYTAGKYPEEAMALAQQIHSLSERAKAIHYIETAAASRKAAASSN